MFLLCKFDCSSNKLFSEVEVANDLWPLPLNYLYIVIYINSFFNLFYMIYDICQTLLVDVVSVAFSMGHTHALNEEIDSSLNREINFGITTNFSSLELRAFQK
jgi:hypothetical protein